MSKIHAMAIAGLALLLPAAAAQAAQVAALLGEKTIAVVDTASSSVVKTWDVVGIEGPVAGIDVRPADGRLYALAADGTLYTIDLATGRATMGTKLDTMLAAGVAASVDFNPVADRLRVIGADGTSLRVNVEDGKVVVDGSLAYAQGDLHHGTAPQVVAAAYTNAVKGAKATTLYDVDAATGALLRQDPPNDGLLNTIGALGLEATPVAFDIRSEAEGANEAWLMTPDGLHSLDLASGAAGPAIRIEGLTGPVRDIAVLPAM